jgi:16S rRNA (guanine527-N7)-methyltransferase
MSAGFDLEFGLENVGLHLDSGAKERLTLYLDLLVQWNHKTNLVGPRDARTIFETLLIDSLRLAPFLERLGLPAAPLCLDLGAGAGLPGIPLRCCWERGEYHLVEVREKRCVFMRLAVGRMGLARTLVYQGRAEDALAHVAKVAARPDGQAPLADLVLSRAFMPWPELLPFVCSMLAPQGRVVVLANEPAPETLPEGWEAQESESYAVRSGATSSERWFWALRKSSEN